MIVCRVCVCVCVTATNASSQDYMCIGFDTYDGGFGGGIQQ